METVIAIVFAIMSLALVMALIRVLIGPTLPDRVVALELMVSITVGMIATYTIATGVDDFIDVAVVLALTAFLAAIGFARYVEKRGAGDD